MNKEEKEAIEIGKEITFIRGIREDVDGKREDLFALEKVLNYIDKLQKRITFLREEIYRLNKMTKKQQKENEELKERNKGLTTAIEEWVNGERINDIKHISKDKIRDKIKELEENLTQTYGILGESLTTPAIKILKELLEENQHE